MPSIFHPDHPDHVPRTIRRGETRWMLGRNIWTGVLGNVGIMYLTGGLFFVSYCQEMGMQKYHFGILRTVASLMMPLLLLSPAIEERLGRRKYPCFMLLMASRVSLAPLLLGLLFPISPWVIVACIAVYSALASMGTPLWQSWTWDYIPMSIYARFFARRTFWVKLSGTAFFVVATLVVDLTSPGTVARRQFVSGAFVLLLALSITDLMFHVRIPEPPRKAPPAGTRSKIMAALKRRPFRNWLLATAVWSFAVAIAGPFCVPYMIDELGFGEHMFIAAVLLAVIPAVGSLATLGLWGKLLDTRHTALVMSMCFGIWAFIPLFFFYATPANATWMMACVWTIGGIFPAGATLAMPLVTARLTGVEKTMPAALRLVAMGLGGAAGAAVGTVILRAFSVQHAFMASFAARLTAAFIIFLLLVVRPAAERSLARTRRVG